MARPASGQGVDFEGRAVIDPTKNVLDLVAAETKRQDDLRKQESDHVREVMMIRERFFEELRLAEAARIDAIRAVDVGNVQRAAEVQAAQAATLATQVAVSAETLRTQVASTAAQGTLALAAALDPIQKDIADLRRAQYEAQGQKTQVVERQAQAGGIGLWIGVAVAMVAALIAVYALSHNQTVQLQQSPTPITVTVP